MSCIYFIGTNSLNKALFEGLLLHYKGKRARSNSNEKIRVELPVSPNKKQKSADNKTNMAAGNDNSRSRKQLNKYSVLIVVTEIPENTYLL